MSIKTLCKYAMPTYDVCGTVIPDFLLKNLKMEFT